MLLFDFLCEVLKTNICKKKNKTNKQTNRGVVQSVLGTLTGQKLPL